jgi:shikimate dehydrogenase
MTDPWPAGTTRLVALLGWPARYSRSPAAHNAAFRALGIDLVYVVLPCADDDLPTVVHALRATGAAGANITVPHKTAVMGLCDRIEPEAALVGAVNTLVFDEGRIVGDNTDTSGLVGTWRSDLRIADGKSIAVLGSGGAARAVAVAAGRLGSRLAVIGRRPAACGDIAEIALRAGASEAIGIGIDDPSCAARVEEATLVVNATPLGTNGEALPAPFMQLRADQVAHDLIYAPAQTPFLAAAAANGAGAHNGLGMLLHQAAHAFERWTSRSAPLEVMRSALA